MVAHERLTEEVASRAHLSKADDAAHTVRVVVAGLAHRLDMPLRQRLRQAMPGPERDAAYAIVPPAHDTPAGLLEEVARNLQTPQERADRLTHAVLSVIADEDPALGRALREGLAPSYAELFTAPESSPERLSAAGDAPAPLSNEEVRTELRRRPQWSGDSHRLTRTVGLPADRTAPLLRQVEKDARELRHKVDHTTTGDGITFTLRTRSVDAVTRADLEMADRIDAAVDAVGSGGHPG
ncbi:4a-hydroxytetrahydrobiopterin dehydratase [Streptomyces sp. TRM S81-3]|uniref:Putative pterin-4-alpha-carbinolamine dehydratase n=1 Tax=Streptomyces griseicoloratus TaxID=2752516 RepID=A0A926L820_9ACTN|nr:4a-hydroxytetrahydrobiopterin dehydratase [Streptomyces griseicoloratus]MBD0421788.1 4a-hydroxytetrahydrobiopterin dehydratase [Streptomyces griseicoloratus]